MKNLLFSLIVFLSLTACTGSTRIQSSGLKGISLGTPMPAEGLSRYKGRAARDTFLEEGKYEWRALRLEYPGGPVYVEEDFFHGNTINRIRILSPKMQTQSGLRVGATVAELKAAAGDWFIKPLPAFGLFDLYSRTSPNVHYLLAQPGLDMNGNWESYSLDQFQPETRVQMIVLQ